MSEGALIELRAEQWRALSRAEARVERAKGLDALWHGAVGGARRIAARAGRGLGAAERVLALEGEYRGMSAGAFGAAAEAQREVFRRGKDSAEDVARAFALVREAARRELGLLPYAEQVAGGLAMARGCVAEMATGEGKTLTATMPAVVAGWRGRGCHIVTVNDYLARRDAEWMAPVYRACGVDAAWIAQDAPPEVRRRAYAADVTYTTSKEVAADFLRDRIALGPAAGLAAALLRGSGAGNGSSGGGGGLERLVMRGLNAAIVDEADSVLIDEAVTPLIIAGAAPNAEMTESHRQGEMIAAGLMRGRDYRVNERYGEIELTDRGRDALDEQAERLGGVWSGVRRSEELVTLALTARELFLRGKNYLVQDGKILIIDELTGRLMPDRTWRDGLHQAVEAKEGLEIQAPKDTLARISFQRFFRMYGRLSGMTGTAREEAAELWATYRLPVAVIPTHRKCRRIEERDRVFATAEAKRGAVERAAVEIHGRGAPLLIGTRTVAESERLSARLSAMGLEHAVLNAERHAEEAAIIARAGEAGRITIATNMAGRGTDIRLGAGVAEMGGLHVIATERHESRRIDRQLFGRAGRQGDPGWARAFVSLEDELPVRFAPAMASAAKRWADADGEVSAPGARALFGAAQKRAQKLARQRRRAVLRSDDWLEEALGFAGREF